MAAGTFVTPRAGRRAERARGPRLLCTVAALVVLACVPTGCDEQTAAGVESVKLGQKWFHLELAETPEKRFQGLSGRTEIAPDGGMLFVFPRAQQLSFVMRDCPIPIDIVFLDASGRIVAMHQMQVEEPRRADEPKTSDPAADRYEMRLKRYSSRYSAQFVVEIRGGTLPSLGLKEGDKVELDAPRLKSLAK